MPRVSNSEYYRRHDVLRTLWLNKPKAFGLLPPHQQRQLHRYYQPAHELSRKELRKYRRDITKRNPSLPHTAGKLYRSIEYALHSSHSTGCGSRLAPYGSQDGVVVHGISRPEIDVPKLARALIETAEQMNPVESEQN